MARSSQPRNRLETGGGTTVRPAGLVAMPYVRVVRVRPEDYLELRADAVEAGAVTVARVTSWAVVAPRGRAALLVRVGGGPPDP